MKSQVTLNRKQNILICILEGTIGPVKREKKFTRISEKGKTTSSAKEVESEEVDDNNTLVLRPREADDFKRQDERERPQPEKEMERPQPEPPQKE